MSTPMLEKEYTPDDLLRLPEPQRYELIDGRLVERAMGAQSSEAAANLIGLLNPHVHAERLGRLFGSDCGYQIFPDRPKRVRLPDVSFISRGRLPNDKVPEGHIGVVPDLVVEAISPNDLALEVEEKIEEYLRVGVPLVWVVYPRTRTVLVFRADGSVSRLRSGDELSGENVVPGFRCKVSDLFTTPA